MYGWLLKTGATLLTLLTAAAAAGYVSLHVKNATAPLHPAVVGSAATGQLGLTGSVRMTNVEAVTSTYAS